MKMSIPLRLSPPDAMPSDRTSRDTAADQAASSFLFCSIAPALANAAIATGTPPDPGVSGNHLQKICAY